MSNRAKRHRQAKRQGTTPKAAGGLREGAKGRWYRKKAAIQEHQVNLGADETWRGRYTRENKVLARALIRAGLRNIAVLDLAGGIIKGRSYTAEDMKRILEARSRNITDFTVVDRLAENGLNKKIRYVKGNVECFIRNLREPLPDVIVARRLIEHLPQGQRMDFVTECWKKMPEGGFFVSEMIVTNNPFFMGDLGAGRALIFPIIARKINGLIKVIHISLHEFGKAGNKAANRDFAEQLVRQYENGSPITRFGNTF